jgi:hypothetical protein
VLPGSPAWQAGGGDRTIAYAAALGAAPDAIAALAPSGKLLWSSYTGTWRQVRVGDPAEQYAPGPGALAGVTVLLAMFAVLALFITSQWGLKWGAAFTVFPGCIWWGSCWYVYHRAAGAGSCRLKQSSTAWCSGAGPMSRAAMRTHPTSHTYCVAIDNGQRDRAWALSIGRPAGLRRCPGRDGRACPGGPAAQPPA